MGMQAIPSETGSSVAGPMEQTQLTTSKDFVRDLADGQEVDSIFVVRERARKETRSGDHYLRLQLGDVTGSLTALIWDGVEHMDPDCVPGGGGPRGRPLLGARALRPADHGQEAACGRQRGYDPADLHEGPVTPVEQMAADLEALVETVQRPHLRELLERLLGGDTEIGRRWRVAPAAKYYHQAYRHGLLEHSLSVAQGVSAMAARFPGIDRDVSVTARSCTTSARSRPTRPAATPSSSPTTASCWARSRSATTSSGARSTRSTASWPRTPRRSCTSSSATTACWSTAARWCCIVREATLVHAIDKLGGTLGSFDRLEKSLADYERWSGFDRGISGSAYFAPPAADAGREAA